MAGVQVQKTTNEFLFVELITSNFHASDGKHFSVVSKKFILPTPFREMKN